MIRAERGTRFGDFDSSVCGRQMFLRDALGLKAGRGGSGGGDGDRGGDIVLRNGWRGGGRLGSRAGTPVTPRLPRLVNLMWCTCVDARI